MKYSRSRDLTVTNKILHYLLAGLAVVASDTAGQSEISEQATGAVAIYPAGDSKALANHLNALLASPERLRAAKLAALWRQKIFSAGSDRRRRFCNRSRRRLCGRRKPLTLCR